jgi:putative transposase
MAEKYLLACTRYVELNPVRAGLVKEPETWPWSSAKAHINEQNDILVKTSPLLQIVKTDWKNFLTDDVREPEIEQLRKHERTGRPLGEGDFVEKIELLLDRKLNTHKPGPKKKDK